MIDTYRRQKTKLDDETRGNVGHKIQKLDIINYSYASGLAPGIAVGDGRGSKSSEAIRFAIPLQHSSRARSITRIMKQRNCDSRCVSGSMLDMVGKRVSDGPCRINDL